jgi:alkylhydroperoxidase/carboxymuconolactone decarboxylase family protein YurZ
VEDYETILRRLSLPDDGYVESLLRDDRESLAVSRLDPRTHALVRLGALIAMDAVPPCFMSAADAADAAGATREQIVGTLVAVIPVVGVPRVVSAAPNLGLAIGYDVAEALETRKPAARAARDTWFADARRRSSRSDDASPWSTA